ncbi:NUDIX domain-containing protein [Microbacterium sp. zg.B48]|uniref:NUDIX hydrolase n=1 Tax=unclassified Microbacterium TaxID=2609290 RepID=UPI00214D0A7E|nr:MULTISPECIES: NUDIX domain-containing protein [unclassified Microbacterium]MCR2764059.1 NUDIX domain-containing protein [Microbacterium sp. zg.B48]MCR2810480.1 NUDIX domain-containing protein [Microbacterium sp. zg.B185]WIM18531.1 NUDIX domain-containing protein [Microbacterium sp. zg-B185]
MTAPLIFVSAAVITDAAGRVLVVRKQGTSVFMQPGGKPEHGESAAEALSRELHEEVGLVVAPDDLEPLGTFEADAANEPGHRVVAAAFRTTAEPAELSARAEIAELRWITPGDVAAMELAPLSLDHLLALAWG